MRRSGVNITCDLCGGSRFKENNPFSTYETFPEDWIQLVCHITSGPKHISYCISGEIEDKLKNEAITTTKVLDICPGCWNDVFRKYFPEDREKS